MKRRRFKQVKSFQDRLSEFVTGERAKAVSMSDAMGKYELLKNVKQAETAAANIEAWANSSELQPPK